MLPVPFNDFANAQVAALPRHLRKYIVPQHYEKYTALDQAIWRYVMRQNYSCLKDVAYYPYIPGLKAAGLSIECIPDLQQMNDALGEIGWGAVTVNGFIPPSAFMEFQMHRVLVIAADIRSLEHIQYTPAPDIIHESAGHAPIIADKDYHQYLSYFGSIGVKAVSSAQDREVYEAIRTLSILKESPNTDPAEIKKAEERLAFCQYNIGEPSEMALLSRLHWWTVEYGLIGTPEDYKIFGAGLLSSIGESASCTKQDVKKLVYDLNAVNYPYDITKPQPQLFVTPTFQHLIAILEQFADSMSFRTGGTHGLQKALESKTTCTAVFSSGLEVSGTFVSYKVDDHGRPAYIQTAGPTQLAYNGQELEGHAKTYHADGFGSACGKVKNFDTPLAYRHIEVEKLLVLHFDSGITVMGVVKSVIRKESKSLLISFKGCSVIGQMGETLFDPAWGVYDLAVGENIVSVYSGAADKDAFEDFIEVEPQQEEIIEERNALSKLYEQVRKCRENGDPVSQLEPIWKLLRQSFPEDWLCALEILELMLEIAPEHEMTRAVRGYLTEKAMFERGFQKLIMDGIRLAEQAAQKTVSD